MSALLPHTHAVANQVMVWVPMTHSPPIGSIQDVMVHDRRVRFKVDGGQVYGEDEILVWGPECDPPPAKKSKVKL